VPYADRWKCRTQKIAKNSPSGHHRTTLFGYTFATKARIVNRKKLLNNNVSPTCPHNMNFGPIAAEICWRVWAPQQIYNGFRVLSALLHGTRIVVVKVCGVEQRAPPTFGRAAITLGIGPHFSCCFFSIPCGKLSWVFVSFWAHVNI